MNDDELKKKADELKDKVTEGAKSWFDKAKTEVKEKADELKVKADELKGKATEEAKEWTDKAKDKLSENKKD